MLTCNRSKKRSNRMKIVARNKKIDALVIAAAAVGTWTALDLISLVFGSGAAWAVGAIILVVLLVTSIGKKT